MQFISYDYPPNDGGISWLVAEVTAGLDKRGHDVGVLTLDGRNRAGPIRPEVATNQVAHSGRKRDFATYRYIRSLPDDAKLVASVWNPEGTLAWLVGRSRRLWIMAHGNEVMQYPNGIGFRLKKWLRHRVLASVEAVICNGRYTEGLVKTACPSGPQIL